MDFFTIVHIRQVNKALSMELEKKLPIPRLDEHTNNSAIQRFKIQNNGYLKYLMPNFTKNSVPKWVDSIGYNDKKGWHFSLESNVIKF